MDVITSEGLYDGAIEGLDGAIEGRDDGTAVTGLDDGAVDGLAQTGVDPA